MHDAEGRLSSAATGTSEDSPATRYAHNALGQRVFKTEPLYAQLAEEDPGFLEQLWSFFRQLWAPQTQSTEMVGWAYAYDEDGTLLSEVGQGGPQSSGASHYIWLPTANGPMPIAAIVNGNTYAVHADHLNTPRRLTDEQGRPAWQWKYSAFGDEAPTRGAKRFVDPEVTPGYGNGVVADVSFNLRYPGQYADAESGLFYNYFRSYDSRTGRYTQADPIGLDGGWNRFAYVEGNPLGYADPEGLQSNGSYRNPAANQLVGHGGGGGAPPMPNFAVSSNGTAFPIPSGARGPVPVTNPGGKVTGSAFTGGSGGTNGQVCTVRFMDPTPPRGASPGYPTGYVKYENASGQGVDPYTGRTVPNSQSHFPK